MAPFRYPNSSDPTRFDASAPQLTATNGPTLPESACTAEATTSLPVPVSPRTTMGTADRAVASTLESSPPSSGSIVEKPGTAALSSFDQTTAGDSGGRLVERAEGGGAGLFDDAPRARRRALQGGGDGPVCGAHRRARRDGNRQGGRRLGGARALGKGGAVRRRQLWRARVEPGRVGAVRIPEGRHLTRGQGPGRGRSLSRSPP